MRRAIPLVLVVLLAASVAPQRSEARGLGGILGVITNPIGSILGAARHAGRRTASHRRSYAGRARQAAPVAAAAGVTGGAAAASASAPATAKPSETTVPAVATQDSPAPAVSQTKAAAGETSDTKAAPATEPAAVQKTATVAAVTQPNEPTPSPPSANFRRLGMVGPAAWPTAFEDVIGYALWPKDYGARLRAHGIGDVLATAFTPGPALIAHAQTSAKKDEPKTSGSASSSGTCANISATAPDWPTADIEHSLTLNDAQRGALAELKTAIDGAAATIRATCRDEAAPVDRLRALQNTLWAVHDAAQTIRAPLAKFYDQLSDEEKKQFAAPAQAQTDAQAMGRSDVVRMCGAPNANELPMQRVEQSLHTSKPQRASLDSLQKKSFEMGQFLMASCLKPVAATPAERLDAATDRLTAVIFAASNVNMALNDFTSQLDGEQKTKLNSLGR
jgi:hypothetical protein